MDQIGKILKDARERKGLSLDQVEENTKIKKTYLRAIEAGDIRSIPGMVYQKGFIRIYAKVVGIDSEALIARYNQIASVQLAINSASEENNPKEKSRLKKVTNKVLNGLGFRFGH